MKDKEKQIEEITKDICKTCQERHGCLSDCRMCRFTAAQIILEKYQPKLPEDGIVLSRKLLEINDIKSLDELVIISRHNLMAKLELKEKKVSKETVEKYKGFIRELLTNGVDSITTYYGDVKYRLIREDDLQELAKGFDIEV